jgi:glycine cleavage system aminomethyltransferase T
MGEIIYRNEKVVGYLSSAGYSHNLGAPIGLGFVSLVDKSKDEKVKTFVESGIYEVEMVNKDRKIVRVPVSASFSCVVDPKGARVQWENGVQQVSVLVDGTGAVTNHV